MPSTIAAVEVLALRGANDRLRVHERPGRHDARLAPRLFQRLLPVVHHHVLAERQDANVRAADEDFLTKIVLQPVHHAHDDDQRADRDRHAADRDQADQRQQLRAAPAAQISPRDATARDELIPGAASERG